MKKIITKSDRELYLEEVATKIGQKKFQSHLKKWKRMVEIENRLFIMSGDYFEEEGL